MKKYLVILSAALLLFSCSKSEQETSVSAPVLFSLDTKSLGAGERTFRVALFNVSTKSFLAQGTYCSDLIAFPGTFPYGQWLSPCRVDNDGLPLKDDETEAIGLTQADKDSKYGLRYQNDGSYYFVAASPAKAFSSDGYQRYYPWTAATATSLFVSEPVIAGLSGSWLAGEYVYKPSTRDALTLKNRSASIKIQIECGAQEYADIQSVALLNLVTDARWYMTSGFSATPAHYTISPTPSSLYDCAGTPMHIVKANNDSWTSSEVYIPSIDFSDNTFAAMRPVIEVELGSDTAHPSTALIDITEKVDPMKNYTYNLYVSKSVVIISLSVAGWDDGGTINSTDSENPGIIRTVTVDEWSDGGSNTADPLIDS